MRARLMRRLRPWLLPTFVAPPLSAALLVSVNELANGSGALGWLRWLVLVLLAGLVSFGLSITLVTVDGLLLLLRWRSPPTDRRAWIGGLAAPVPAYGAWLLLRPSLFSSPLSHALALAGALVLAAILVRLASSPRLG